MGDLLPEIGVICTEENIVGRLCDSVRIEIRDDTMSCETMKQCDANDIVMYLTTM